MLRALLTLFALTLVAGCGGPSVRLGEGSDLRRAESVAVLADSAIPLQHDEPPGVLAGADLASLASRGAGNVGAAFVARDIGPVSGPHLVLRFENTSGFGPDQLCRGEPPSSGPWFQSPPQLTAVMCRDTEPLASATGVADDADAAAAERLVTATVARLFPGQFRGSGITLGGGIGSGGDWGLGAGIGF